MEGAVNVRPAASRSGGVLRGPEEVLSRQVRELTEYFAGVGPTATRMSKFPLWLPRSPVTEHYNHRKAMAQTGAT